MSIGFPASNISPLNALGSGFPGSPSTGVNPGISGFAQPDLSQQQILTLDSGAFNSGVNAFGNSFATPMTALPMTAVAGALPVGAVPGATTGLAPVFNVNQATGSGLTSVALQPTNPSEAAFDQQLASFDSQFGSLFQLGASMSPVAQNLLQQYQVALVQQAQQQQQEALAAQQAAFQQAIAQQQAAIQQAQQQAMLQQIFGQFQQAITSLGQTAATPAAAPAADVAGAAAPAPTS